MPSHRKRKRDAAARDLSVRELELVEILEEVLESVRWQQILGYTNQFLLDRYVKVEAEERDKILEAAVRAVDKDGRLHEWQERVAQLKGECLHVKRSIQRAKKDIAQGKPAPPAPTGDARQATASDETEAGGA